jgi:hypothetical protein
MDYKVDRSILFNLEFQNIIMPTKIDDKKKEKKQGIEEK